MIDSLPHWGLHTLLDITDCHADEIRDASAIELWIKNLVELLDMEPFGDPVIVKFGKEDKLGYTAFQLIQTSNICAHFSEDTNSAFIDVFSCKPYDPILVRDYCIDVFGGIIKNFKIIDRKCK